MPGTDSSRTDPVTPGGTGQADASERRNQPRVGDCPPLLIGGIEAVVHDVSRNGICLILETPLPRGERVQLTVIDALDRSSRDMDAEVVWHAADRTGLRWLNLTRDHDQWLLGRFQAWLRAMDGASRR
jgi:hypothetical protein